VLIRVAAELKGGTAFAGVSTAAAAGCDSLEAGGTTEASCSDGTRAGRTATSSSAGDAVLGASTGNAAAAASKAGSAADFVSIWRVDRIAGVLNVFAAMITVNR
jgi:hypothetical protein